MTPDSENRLRAVLNFLLLSQTDHSSVRYTVAPLFDLKSLDLTDIVPGRFWIGTPSGGTILPGNEVLSVFRALFDVQQQSDPLANNTAANNATLKDLEPGEAEAIIKQILFTKANVQRSIFVFNAAKTPPFPLERRHLKLDWSQLEDAQVGDVMRVIHERKAVHQEVPKNVKMTMQIDAKPSPTDTSLYKYRKYFREISQEEFSDIFLAGIFQRTLPHTILGDPEYIEDTAGNPVTKLQMMQQATGREDIILMDDVNTVLRFGPSPPKNVSDWSARDSTTIAHFLDVVERISKSDWHRSRFSMTTAKMNDDSTEQVALQVPGTAAMLGVIPLFRQLHSNDELFNKACNVYKRFCSMPAKIDWIAYYQDWFAKLRKDTPTLPTMSVKNSDLLDTFYYGTKAFHAQSKHGAEGELAKLLATYGQPTVVMAVNSCLLHMLGYAGQVYYVIKQDYAGWLSSGLSAAEKIDLDELFRSYG